MNEFIDRLRTSRLLAYTASPGDIREHFGIEQVVLAGGYGYRQVLELVQNGADAILEARSAGTNQGDPPRIEVLLEGSCLYVANTGAPFNEEGINALLRSHSSPKRGNQIGRFGLGFKSLLRLGGKIDITSGQAAFGLDPDRCRAELRDQFKVQDAPGLRLAWPLDKTQADLLRGRFPWATTVVRADVTAESFLDHLRAEIEGFPAEFLLFLPVCVKLTLERGDDGKRELRREPDGQDMVLCEGDEKSRWRVMEKLVSVTDQRAKDDATHVHARDVVPLAWAMPIDSKRDEAGRFWAFFPTHTPTYLPGILNAPWKLNSDRNAIIPGEWNAALMKEAATLIAETLAKPTSNADPGSVLDAFPRQLERADEDAAPLIMALWNHLVVDPVIPDGDGQLRPARELRRHPRDNSDLARQWLAIANQEQRCQMVHASCMERQRGSRLKALAERLPPEGPIGSPYPDLRQRDAKEWFTDIASTERVKAVQVLKLAEAYHKDCKPTEWEPIRSVLPIVPTDDDKLVNANQAVLAPEGTHVPGGRHPVAKWLCDDMEAKRILVEVLKVKPLDDSVWLEVLLGAMPQPVYRESPPDDRWRAFWVLLRSAPEKVRNQFAIQYAFRLRVRRRDNEWMLADEVLFPGTLVDASDTSTNRNLLVDEEFHNQDKDLLRKLGVSDCPNGLVDVGAVGELDEWLKHWRRAYLNENPQRQNYTLSPDNLQLPNGWKFLAHLTGTPNAKLTGRLLADLTAGRIGTTVRFGCNIRRSDAFMDASHPLLWVLLKYGSIPIGDQPISLAAILARLSTPILAKVPDWQTVRPPLEKLKGAIPQVTASPDQIFAFWDALIKTFATPDALTDDSLRELWSGAARDGIIANSLQTADGDVPLAQVYVTGSPDLARRARKQGHIVVTLDADAITLWLENGARDLAELMRPQWTEETGLVALLLAAIPEVADVVRPEVRETARCRPVSGLRLLVADEGSPVPCLMWENTLIIDTAQMAFMSRVERLQHLLAELAAAGWLEHSAGESLQILGDAEVDRLRDYVAAGVSLGERLLRAVGNRDEPLRRALGAIGTSDFLQGIAPLQLAELVLAQLGPATLTTLKETLDKEGLKPPPRWNTGEARAFVASIGFTEEFAASPESRREAEEFISGPIELPLLHDFQEEVLGGIRELIARGPTRRRAVVSLPTGGGKTRVTVEAAVLLVLKPESSSRSVVWVAQTDELCEQAVQAFRQVWLNLGAKSTDLRIVRLWGGNPNPATPEPDKPVVVVASIQTLNSRMAADGLAWIRKPGLVVVDECHHAITPSYTNLLRFIDAEAPRPGDPPKDEPPILGLSATPFRTNDDESQRLARRFDNRWLPADQEDLHRRLRDQGVLATVDHEALDSGIGLTPEEIERLSKLSEPWEGIDFENLLESINQRLAGNRQRNERLVERIEKAQEHSILLFANSVLHADEMAARLNLKGIKAAAVSGDTPTIARRYFLPRFQSGEIRVLCNHTVLSTGFDAPKTDMVLISRAVFSPVRYMQMVGRGLRGVKNGGKPRCRIITVLDNLGRFQDRHPYHYCSSLFAP
jgi:superfamily II DNA or RNA helicase